MLHVFLNGIKFSFLTSLEKLVVVFLSFYLARSLTVSDFGQYGLLLSFVLILNTIFIGGLNTIFFRLISDKEHFEKRYELLLTFFSILLKRMIIVLPIFWFVYMFLIGPRIGPLSISAIFYASSSAALGAYLSLYGSVLLVERNYRLISYVSFVRVIFLLMSIYMIKYFPISHLRFVFELLSAIVLIATFVIPIVRKTSSSWQLQTNNIGMELIKKYRTYGGYTLVIQIFMMSVNGYDKFILGVFHDQYAVALYTMFWQFLFGIFIINAFNSVLSNQYFSEVRDNVDGFNVSLKTSFYLCVFVVPLKVSLVIFGSSVLRLLSGNDYMELSPYLIYVADIYLLYALYLIFNKHFHFKLDGKKLMLLTVSGTSLGITLSALLIYFLGAEGAIYGALTTYFILALFCYVGARMIYTGYGSARGDLLLATIVILMLGISFVSIPY